VHLVSYTDNAGGPQVGVEADGAVFPTHYRDMLDFIVDGDQALMSARDALEQGRTAENVQLLAPLPRPGKMLFLGRSFREFRAGLDDDVEPFVYSRVPSSVIGPGESIRVPEPDATVLYEGELLVVVGRLLRRADAGEAMRAVFGYTQVNDITWTDWLESPHGGPRRSAFARTRTRSARWALTLQPLTRSIRAMCRSPSPSTASLRWRRRLRVSCGASAGCSSS